MKLPKFSDLQNKDHHLLYSYDIKQLGSGDPYLMHLGQINRVYDIVRYIRRLCNKGLCLDIGCAQAYVTLILAEKGFTSIGFDINYNFLTYAKIKREKGKVFLVTGDATNLSFKRNSFDIVVLGEILEHAAYPENIIMEAMNVLKKGGYCIITTPNGERVGNTLPTYNRSRNFLGVLVRKQYGPEGRDHLFAFTKKELRKMLEKLGLKVIYSRNRRTFLLNRVLDKIFYLRHLHIPISLYLFIDEILSRMPIINRKITDSLFIVVRK